MGVGGGRGYWGGGAVAWDGSLGRGMAGGEGSGFSHYCAAARKLRD